MATRRQLQIDEIADQYTGSEILNFLTEAELSALHARLRKDGMLEEDDASDADDAAD